MLLTLHRGDQFNQDVDIRVRAPRDLSVDPRSTTIRSSDTNTLQLVITADEDAALVTHEVVVEATPSDGKATWLQIPVKVTPR